MMQTAKDRQRSSRPRHSVSRPARRLEGPDVRPASHGCTRGTAVYYLGKHVYTIYMIRNTYKQYLLIVCMVYRYVY